MKYLNEDEKDALNSILDSPECVRALIKTIEVLAAARDQAVVRFNLTPDNFTELALTKARAEGARFLASDFRRELDRAKAAVIAAVEEPAKTSK